MSVKVASTWVVFEIDIKMFTHEVLLLHVGRFLEITRLVSKKPSKHCKYSTTCNFVPEVYVSEYIRNRARFLGKMIDAKEHTPLLYRDPNRPYSATYLVPRDSTAQQCGQRYSEVSNSSGNGKRVSLQNWFEIEVLLIRNTLAVRHFNEEASTTYIVQHSFVDIDMRLRSAGFSHSKCSKTYDIKSKKQY